MFLGYERLFLTKKENAHKMKMVHQKAEAVLLHSDSSEWMLVVVWSPKQMDR